MTLWLFVLLAFAAFFFLDWITLLLRGDCRLRINTDQIQNLVRTKKGSCILFSFDVPLENQSTREQALLIFAGIHHVPERKEDKLVSTWTRVTLAGSPRKDGYFESTLVKPGKTILLHAEALLEEIKPEGLKQLTFELSYSYYGRRPMTTDRVDFSIPAASFVDKEEALPQEPSPAAARQGRPNVIPIGTHLIFPGEDLSKVIQDYTREEAKSGDWLAIAESVVAIAQGRVYPVQTIKPGFWAKRLNRFFQYNSSLASCYSMEWAIREAGLIRILPGVVVGMIGRLLGRSGDFYRVAGRAVAAIDDCTGTLPPFDKSVVLGPKDPDQVAKKIREETGLEIAIVDANDLGKVDILGKSSEIVDQELVDLLRDNPQGNADEQTPIVLIKRK